VESSAPYKDCVERYIKLRPELVKQRYSSTFVKTLGELREILGVSSVAVLIELGQKDPKSLIEGMQILVNNLSAKGRAGRTIRFHVYLLRSFLNTTMSSFRRRK